MAVTYSDAGVDIDEADRATSRIKRLAERTFTDGVLTGVGAFGAAYSLNGLGLEDPVLVSSADGVGTKLQLAFMMGVHDTVGQCLVNHCVNDIAVQGARPLFFLDYFGVGKLEAETAAEVVSGLSKACEENGCALIGGETAEMPGMYRPGEYDLAGFIVGAADRAELFDQAKVAPGDVLLGLPSTGLHTNGYSLARKLFFDSAGRSPAEYVDELGTTVGDELLKVHRSYLKPIQTLATESALLGAAHITGGGITDNLPRALPGGTVAQVKLGSWPVLPVFNVLQRIGHVAQDEMLRTFNMGIGMILIVPAAETDRAVGLLKAEGETPYRIGSVASGGGKPEVEYV